MSIEEKVLSRRFSILNQFDSKRIDCSGQKND
jgi:hypothetical protein